MKIRNGYVSNSSSASYLIAIGIVKKEFIKNVKEWLDKIATYHIEFADFVTEDKTMSIKAFNGDCVSLNCKKDDFVISIWDKGDVEVDEYGEIIGDVDWSNFDEMIAELFYHDEWFEKTDASYGSGFDG